MTELNILAVQNAPLLTAIAATPDATKATLATAANKDRSNLNRSLNALVEAGLVQELSDTHRALTRAGEDQLHAIRRAEGADRRFPQQIGDIRLLRHDQILADPNNAREDWDSDEARDELDALRADIIQAGLLQNLIVRAGEAEDTFVLIGGERRWRAIGLAIFDDDWPKDRPIPCRVVDVDDLGNRLAALSENLQRRNLNPLEKARAFEGLAQAFADQGVEDARINREIADRIGVTIEHVQQHRSFMKLDEADQQRLTLAKDDPRRLSVSDARKKLSSKKEAASEVEIDPDTRLLLAEILHAVRARTTYTYADLEVDPSARDDARLATLVRQGQLRFEPEPARHGDLAGRFVVALGYQFAFAAFDWSSAPDPEVRDTGLVREWNRAVHHPERFSDGYATSWLNPPFEITPQGQAIIDERAAEDALRAEAAAETARQRQEAEAARAADLERQALIAARSRDLFAASRRQPPRPDDVTTLAKDAESPLPWRLNHKGDVVAADGSLVIGGRTNDRAEARMRLLVLALNTVGCFETPEDEPDPNPTLTEDQFVAAMAACLTQHEVKADAAPLLADFLSTNGVAYGEDGWEWTAAGAAEVCSDAIAMHMAGGPDALFGGEPRDEADA